MNKKFILFLIVSLCLASTMAFAEPDYEARNVFNRMTDWSATMWKPASEKKEIIDQRVQDRAQKRKAHDALIQKKHEINEDYKKELLFIYDHNGDNAEVMAQKLKEASENHKKQLRELE